MTDKPAPADVWLAPREQCCDYYGEAPIRVHMEIPFGDFHQCRSMEFAAVVETLGQRFGAGEITLEQVDSTAAEAWRAQKEAWRKEKEDARRREALEWIKRHVPLEFQEAIDETKLPNLEAFRRVIAWQPGKRGLLLYGPTGAAKTRAAYELVKRLAFDGERVEIVRAADFGLDVVDLARGGRDGDSLSGYVRRLQTCRILMFDDLDKARFSPAVVTQLLNVIDERTAQHRPMIVTTQASADKLARRMAGDDGEAMEFATSTVRRLVQHSEIVDFSTAAKRNE